MLFAVYLKHFSIKPPADVKPMQNDLLHSIPWQCMFALSMRTLQSAEAGLLNKSSCLAPTLGVTKFIFVKEMILVTLCCATQVRPRRSTNPPLSHSLNLIRFFNTGSILILWHVFICDNQ